MSGILSRRGLLLPLWMGVAAFACAHVPAQRSAPILPVAYVDRDTVWSGDVQVDGVVHVRKSATLTIAPGTQVRFSSAKILPDDSHEAFAGPGIKVEGRIVAVGTEESPIVFTAEGRPVTPASWDKIYFSFSEGNRFEHCVFEGARYAFHAHFSGITVKECVFRDNEEGVRLGVSRVRIEDSVFTRNRVRGINFRECRNEIVRNLVYENGDGIFLHSKSAGSVIRGNAIYGNRRFNLRLGDLHADDVDVSGNWWGTADEPGIRGTIHDGATTPGVGSARTSPALSAPPVAGASIRGLFVFRRVPVVRGEVRAYASAAGGFREANPVARGTTDATGAFDLEVPPGRYFVVGEATSEEGRLFAFPGKNPIQVSLHDTAEVGLPAVVVPASAAPSTRPAARPSITVRATAEGRPVAGVAVQAFRPDRPDFRGPGESTAVTNEEGIATLYLPPGKYLLSARMRTTGAALGMVDEGGLFGVHPDSPVELPAGSAVSVEIPMFEKLGILGSPGGAGGDVPPAVPDAMKAVPGATMWERRPAARLSEGKIGGVLSGEVRLSGRVRVTEDLLVLPGATLILSSGTELVFDGSDSTKVDPEYFFGGTELVVRGTLRAEEAKFTFPDRSGGLVVDGGSASLENSAISGAEAGLTVLGGGSASVEGDLTVADCRVGIALFPGKADALGGRGNVIAKGNGVGAVRFPGGPPLPPGVRTEGNEEAGVIAWDAVTEPGVAPATALPSPSAGARRVGDLFLDADRTFEGDVVVDGIVRVAPGVTLTLLPGTRLFFTFRDTDGDGIGESGIFLQGNLRAKGTADRPIGFFPAEGGDRPGLWDSINFMASDRGENVLEHVEIAGAYRGLHAHFSRLTGKGIRISRCYRGVQFQESEVSIEGLRVESSMSGVRCRDSNVRIRGFEMDRVVSGGNFFRSTVELSGPDVSRPGWYGFRFRDSRVRMAGGVIREAMVGISVQEGKVFAEGTTAAGNGLASVGVLEGDVTLKRCILTGSRVDGLSATRGKVEVSGGEITGYGRHAVKLGGPAGVTLRGTTVSGGKGASRVVFFDGSVSPGLGTVLVE